VFADRRHSEDYTVHTTTLPAHPAPPSALLDVKAVAMLLDCSARHVFRLADAGELPAPIRIGRLVRWRRVDLDSWLASCPTLRDERLAR
jgi:excisionase family DNA binding protein